MVQAIFDDFAMVFGSRPPILSVELQQTAEENAVDANNDRLATLETSTTDRIDTTGDKISGRVAGSLMLLWAVGIAWVFAVAPAADPEAAISTLDVFVTLALYGSWLTVFAGLAARRRMGIQAGVAGGVILAAAGFLCLATGHTGMWIATQIVIGAGLASASATAARLT